MGRKGRGWGLLRGSLQRVSLRLPCPLVLPNVGSHRTGARIVSVLPIVAFETDGRISSSALVELSLDR